MALPDWLVCIVFCSAIHQSEEDDIMNKSETKKSPFGSSFRTFDATDYSSIGKIRLLSLLTIEILILLIIS
jgi:hypothetical protein